MRELIFYSAVTFFSIYGFISMVFFLIDFILDYKYLKDKKMYILITVKNDVCKIENIVRALLFKVYKNDVGVSEQKIIALDLNSDDGTFSMLKKIAKTEKSVLAIKKEELLKKLEKL